MGNLRADLVSKMYLDPGRVNQRVGGKNGPKRGFNVVVKTIRIVIVSISKDFQFPPTVFRINSF